MEQNLQTIETSSLTALESARAFRIVDEATLREAVDNSKRAKAWEKFIVGEFRDLKRAADDAKRALLDKERKYLTPVKELQEIYDPKIDAYLTAEREKADRARREAEEAARKDAETQRKRDSDALKKQGYKEEAKAVLAEPISPVAVAVKEAPKVAGIAQTVSWSAELLSIEVLVKAAAKDPSLLCYLAIDQVAANAAARAMKDSFNVPGIRAVSKSGLSKRV